MNPLHSLMLICQLTGMALLLQTVEQILLRDVVAERGVWKWSTLRGDFEVFPRSLLKIFGIIFRERGFSVLLTFQFFASILILFSSSPFVLIPLFLSALLVSVRWRGAFNGGSDSMTLVLLLSLSVAALFRESSFILTACLCYIAVQSCLSYFISGRVKLMNRHWRRGEALPPFLKSSNYDTPILVQNILGKKGVCKAISWLVILFECTFPLALVSHGFCVVYIGMAILFHGANFYIFGLNRFLFAWLPTYPALFYCSGRIL